MSKSTVLLTTLLLLAVGSAAPSTDHVDSEELSHADAHGDGDPLEMTLSIVGSPSGLWSLIAEGRVALAAPAATLVVTSTAGALTPTGGPASWERTLDLDAGEDFREVFSVAPARGAGGELAVTFDYDASPAYGLHQSYRVTVVEERGALVPKLRLAGADDLTPSKLRGTPSGPGGSLTMEVSEEAVDPASPAWRARLDEARARGNSEATTAGSTTLIGTLKFISPWDSGAYACLHCTVEVWDNDADGLHDYLGTVETSFTGYMSLSIPNNVDSGGTAGQDIFLKISPDSSKARSIRTDGYVVMSVTSVLRTDCPDGTCDMLTQTISLSTDNALRMWLYRNMIWSWNKALYATGSYAIDTSKATARAPVDGWNGMTSNTASYSTSASEIYIGSAQKSPDVHFHEHGHYTMHKAYSGSWPANACPSPHEIKTAYNTGCAWREGWATYWALEVPNDGNYDWSSGSWLNFESYTCNNVIAWCGISDTGDAVEGRVTAALWDLRDSAADGFDTAVYSLPDVWEVFKRGAMDSTFNEYFQSWSLYRPTGVTNFKNAAKQNTINY